MAREHPHGGQPLTELPESKCPAVGPITSRVSGQRGFMYPLVFFVLQVKELVLDPLMREELPPVPLRLHIAGPPCTGTFNVNQHDTRNQDLARLYTGGAHVPVHTSSVSLMLAP